MTEETKSEETKSIMCFYELERDGKTYRFRRPLMSEIELMQSRRNAPIQGQLDFTKNVCFPDDLPAFKDLTDPNHGLPGLSAEVATALLKKMGFPVGV